MAHIWERRPSANGGRLHWVRPGKPRALCGSVVVDLAGRRNLHAARQHDCASCGQKYLTLQGTGRGRTNSARRHLV